MKKKHRAPELVRDIASFTAGSMMIGAGSVATAKVGGSAAGLGALASGMGAVGSVTMLKHTIKPLKKLKVM